LLPVAATLLLVWTGFYAASAMYVRHADATGANFVLRSNRSAGGGVQ